MTTTARPLGQLKSKVTKHCTVCGCSTRRNITEYVYSKSPEAIQEAKNKIQAKANKEYTCRVCKSIKKDLN